MAATAETKSASSPLEEVENMEAKVEVPAVLSDEHSPPPRPLEWSKACAVFFLGLSFMGSISCGFLMVSSILVPIGEKLGDLAPIGWIASSWALSSAVAMSLGGSLSDIFGRRYIILLGQLLTIVGGVVAGTATTTVIVVAGSTILGFGTGFIFVAYAAIPELVPNKYRGIGLAWTECCINVPFGALAVLLSFQLSEHASWRWVYFLSVIITAVCLVGTLLVYFPPSRPRLDYEKTRWQEFLELDFVGYVLFSGGLTILLIGLAWAGQDGHPWRGASVIAPTVLGGILLVGAFVYDWAFSVRNPFLPPQLLRMVRKFTVILVALFVAGMTFFAMASLLPQATQTVYDSEPLGLGIAMIPNGMGLFVGGAVIPSLVHKIRYLRVQIVLALLFQLIFTALYAHAIVPGSKASWMAFQFFGTLSFGWVTTLSYVTVSLHVPWENLGIAAGLLGTFRSSGGAVGITVFTTIRNSVFASQIGPRVAAAAEKSGVTLDAQGVESLVEAATAYAGLGVATAFEGVPGATDRLIALTLEAYRSAYVAAYQKVFYSTIPFCAIAVLAALFVADASHLLTDHVAVQLERNVLDPRSHRTRHTGERASK